MRIGIFGPDDYLFRMSGYGNYRYEFSILVDHSIQFNSIQFNSIPIDSPRFILTTTNTY